MEKKLVIKFGGTSVGSVSAMLQVVKIIEKTYREWPQLVVVTSALSGVTDLLINSAIQAARGDLVTYQTALSTMATRHHELIDGVIHDKITRQVIKEEIDELLLVFENLCQAIGVLGEASPRAMDTVASIGEKLCIRILSAAVTNHDLPAQPFDATNLIITDNNFQNAMPDMNLTKYRCKEVLEPLLVKGEIPIVTGFIAATQSGITTTLGRGGSDYSASLLGVALNASEVWIWTDVDGVMTADPRFVPEAKTIPVISYREVAEMAYYGAKVLHPKSIHPVIEAKIPLRVCNTFNPENPGTWLYAEKDSNGRGGIKAITTIRGLRLVTLAGRGMLGIPGVAGRIFNAVATTGISVPLIIESSSEQSICFAAPRESIPEVLCALRINLSQEFLRQDIDNAYAGDDADIITIICPGLRKTPGIAGQIFSTLGDKEINVLAISYGASDVSINLVVDSNDTESAMRILHTLIQ